MKTAALLFLLSATVMAQDATLESTPANVQSQREARRKMQEDERVKKLIEGKGVSYGGFFVDLARAEKKSKLLSLRQPANPRKDAEHVYVDARSGRTKGFVLFSLDF